MRVASLILLCAALGACASAPPEVRPVHGESAEVEVPDLAAEARVATPERACELWRMGAQTGVEGAAREFALCALERGEVVRAEAVAEAFALDLPVVEALSSESDEEALNRALEVSPDDARLWTRLGALYEREGREAEAVEALQEAHRLSLVR